MQKTMKVRFLLTDPIGIQHRTIFIKVKVLRQ